MQRVNKIYDWSKDIYKPLHYCMYCGATDNLTKEHILPYGLSFDKTIVFPKSSCKTCAEITGKFEGKVLRGPLREVRAIKKLKSRSKFLNFFDRQNVNFNIDGEIKTFKLSLEDRPVILCYPTFEMPAHMLRKDVDGINVKGIAVIDYGNEKYKTIMKKLYGDKAKEVSLVPDSQTYDYYSFARLIAKIAYGFAVAKGELKPLEKIPIIVDYILGKTKNIGRFVGTFTDPLHKEAGLLHKVAIQRRNGMLIGLVKLFANSQSPEYGVILDTYK